MNLCILIPVLVGLICAILGYVIGKLSSGDGSRKDSSEMERLTNKNVQLEADLKECRAKVSTGAAAITSSSAGNNTSATVTAVVFEADAAKAVFGKTIKENNLTIVEGIGPKIQELFHKHEVYSWKALGETTVSRCQEILNTGGERYSVHNPGTWPRQAAMAAKGEWQKLKDWQEILDHGKE